MEFSNAIEDALVIGQETTALEEKHKASGRFNFSQEDLDNYED